MGALKKVVILHGWTYSLDKWSKFTDLLKENGFEVYLPKIPGLTRESNEFWNLDKYTSWLNKLLEKYQDKVVLLGHSNGGRIAINFAAKYPDKLEKLILIDSAGIFHNELPIRLKGLYLRVFRKLERNLLNQISYERYYINSQEKVTMRTRVRI